jgi:hypothetical protein
VSAARRQTGHPDSTPITRLLSITGIAHMRDLMGQVDMMMRCTLTGLQAFLRTYGYIDRDVDIASRRALRHALANYQRLAGLDRQNGRLDRQTLHEMRQPRCGNPDVPIEHSTLVAAALKQHTDDDTLVVTSRTKRFGTCARMCNPTRLPSLQHQLADGTDSTMTTSCVCLTVSTSIRMTYPPTMCAQPCAPCSTNGRRKLRHD